MKIHRFNLNLLPAFNILMQEKHVSNAAKKLNISQSAASKLLNQLREAFDDPLLVRADSGLKATEYALQLHEKSLPIIQEMEELLTLKQGFDPQTFKKTIKIGMPNSISDGLLMPLINQLHQQAPQIVLDIIALDSKTLKQKMDNHEIALAITYASQFPDSCKSTLLFKDDPVCMARKHHPLMKQKAIRIQDYLKEKHVAVIYDEHSPTLLGDRILHKHGFEKRKVKLMVRSPLTALSIISDSNLVLTITKSFAAQFAEQFHLTFRPFSISLDGISVHLVWSPAYDNMPWHKWLRGVIKQNTSHR